MSAARVLRMFWILSTALLLFYCKEADFSGGNARPGKKSTNADPRKGGKGDPLDPKKGGKEDPSDPNGPPETLDSGGGSSNTSRLPKPKFALLARDLRCGLCHVQINGDLSTIGNVMSFEPDRSLTAPGSDDHIVSPFRMFSLKGEYNEKINGTWFISGSFPNDRSKSKMKLKVSGGLKERYVGPEIPKTFPVLDMAKVAKVALGTLDGKDNKGVDVKIAGSSPSNVILDGTSSPIAIKGEVLINGDLAIRGKYIGIGTIYVSGNIYIAGNITASQSAFPFPQDKTSAIARGKTQISSTNIDGLALVSNSAIIMGDPNHATVTGTSKMSPPPVASNNVAGWFPGGVSGYRTFYNGKIGPGISSQWDAFLYAKTMIAGKTGPYVLNGGMICDSFHILGTGSATNVNTINYDYRLQSGLKVMEAFDTAF